MIDFFITIPPLNGLKTIWHQSIPQLVRLVKKIPGVMIRAAIELNFHLISSVDFTGSQPGRLPLSHSYNQVSCHGCGLRMKRFDNGVNTEGYEVFFLGVAGKSGRL